MHTNTLSAGPACYQVGEWCGGRALKGVMEPLYLGVGYFADVTKANDFNAEVKNKKKPA